jgi:xylulokinase
MLARAGVAAMADPGVSAPLVLGVDIGTSSSKGVLARPDGTIVATAEREHELLIPAPGWAEHDAEEAWWGDFLHLCSELVPVAGGQIAGLCVSGIGPCLLAADARGSGLRRAILYGIDTRASAEVAELAARFGEAVIRRCGSRLTSQSVGPKLLWLRRHEPDVWAATRRMFMAGSLIVFRLTGEYVLDHHSASQCGPLYDLEREAWIDEWARDVAPGLELPRLLWPSQVAGRVAPDAAAVTGIPAGTPVAAGTIDAWAEAFSAGVREPGQVMLMYGTTMFIVAPVAQPRPDPRLWLTAWLFPGTRSVAGGMATSGAITAWLRDIMGGPSFAQLTAEAAAVAPGAQGLVVLPYFSGERTPLFDAMARGVVCGLTLAHGRGHLYRAALEATAFGVRHNLETMAEAGIEASELVAVGGGTRGSLWTQIVSDVIGLRQRVPSVTVGASYGDALLAAMMSGLAPASARWDTTAAVVAPDEARRDVYDRLYDVYRGLYPATKDAAHTLARMQRGDGATSASNRGTPYGKPGTRLA